MMQEQPLDLIRPVPYYWAGLRATDVPGLRDTLQPLVEEAIEGWDAGWDAEEVFKKAQAGQVQIWIFGMQQGQIEGVLLTMVLDEPKVCILHILGLAGKNMDQYLQFGPDVLYKWASTKKADFARAITARPGLAKKLLKLGWRQVAVVLELKLEN